MATKFKTVEDVKKAVHPHDDTADGQHFQRRYANYNEQAEHRDQRKAALHIALIHLACARAEGKDKGQNPVFHHDRFPHFV